MKNNLFKILSLNIYLKNSNNFSNLKKVQKTSKQTKNTRKPKNPAQENKKKKLRKNPKQKKSMYRKKNGRALMSRGPYYSARGRSEQRRACGRSIGIGVCSGACGDSMPVYSGQKESASSL
jgi:hypothetical protein